MVGSINFAEYFGDNPEFNFNISKFTFPAFNRDGLLIDVRLNIDDSFNHRMINDSQNNQFICTYTRTTEKQIKTEFILKLVNSYTDEEIAKFQETFNIVLDKSKTNQYIVHYLFNDKLRLILFNEYTVYFLENIVLTIKNNSESSISQQKFNIKNDDLNIQGSFKINKKVPSEIKKSSKSSLESSKSLLESSKSSLELIIDTINGEKLITDVDNKNSLILDKIKINIETFNDYESLFISDTTNKFDFEKFYDNKIKRKKICGEGLNQLVKNFTSSIINLLYIKFNFTELLVNRYSGLIKNLFSQIINQYQVILETKCSNEGDRKFLLTNILKKLNTDISNSISITKYDPTTGGHSGYIKIQDLISDQDDEPTLKVILDTGNSNVTMIGTRFAEILGYPRTRSLVKVGVTGVNKTVTDESNDKIKFRIRFNNPNIDIGKEYEIEAYIYPNGDDNTLLLGNYLDSLTKIFQSSYCIGYETLKSDYDVNKDGLKIDINLQISNAFIQFITDYLHNGRYSLSITTTDDSNREQINSDCDMIKLFISYFEDISPSFFRRYKKYIDNETDRTNIDRVIENISRSLFDISTILDNGSITNKKIRDTLNELKSVLNNIFN